MNNIPLYKENDKIYCIEDYYFINSVSFDKLLNKYGPNYNLIFKKNKLYQILHIEYNRNSESLVYVIIDEANKKRGICNEDFKQIFISVKQYRKLKLKKLSEHTK